MANRNWTDGRPQDRPAHGSLGRPTRNDGGVWVARSLTAAVTLGLAIAGALPAIAQSARANDPVSPSVEFVPRGDGEPDDSVLGGSRGSGGSNVAASSTPVRPLPHFVRGDRPLNDGASVVVLVPALPEDRVNFTASERPSLWLYVSPAAAGARVFFSLQDADDPDAYAVQRVLTLDPPRPSGGLVELALPADAPPLEVGRSYVWQVALSASDRVGPDDPIWRSQMRRIAAPGASGGSANPSPLVRAAGYAQAGIWFDALAELAQWSQVQPQSAEALRAWSDLLRSAGLSAVAERSDRREAIRLGDPER